MEKVILVSAVKTEKKSVNTNNSYKESLEELMRLTETAGGSVVRTVVQKMDRYEPATLIGKGKAQELFSMSRELRVKTIIFDEELSPAQQRNLVDITRTKVRDRPRLILDIFA